MSNQAFRHQSKESILERAVLSLDDASMRVIGYHNQIIEDRSQEELDALLSKYGFNLGDKE